jgi:nucleoside-diphosphate-sugar epimerase
MAVEQRTVALVGAAHPAARALAIALEADPAVDRVLGLAASEPPLLGPKFEYVKAARNERLAAQVAPASIVVLFPSLDIGQRDQQEAGSTALRELRHVLAGIQSAGPPGAEAVILWSSGIVYGAHPGNPVPLTEQSPLRPNDDFPAAATLAEMERLVLDLRSPARTVVLRAAPVWSPDWGTLAGRWLAGPALIGLRGSDPPVQALHPDDVGSALALAVHGGTTDGGLSGVYNVAPSDWVPVSDAAALAGRRRVTLPPAAALAGAERLWDIGVAAGPAGGLRFLSDPWVLDASKLRFEGWAPRHSTADALKAAGRVERDGLAIGRVTVRRADVYRTVGTAVATVAMMTAVRRRLRRF